MTRPVPPLPPCGRCGASGSFGFTAPPNKPNRGSLHACGKHWPDARRAWMAIYHPDSSRAGTEGDDDQQSLL